MALGDLTFIKYLEAAFRHKLFKDPSAIFFNYLGFNLKYKSEAGKKGIFEYARRVLPLAYTNEFADTDDGNLQMARAVIQRLDKEGKDLGVFIEPSQITPEYDLIVADAKQQSEQAGVVQAEPAPTGGEAPGTMIGGIPATTVSQGARIIRGTPQPKPLTEPPLEKRVPGLKTTPETGLDFEGKPFAVPSALKSAGKDLATEAQIGIKKSITRVGGGFSRFLGGTGRAAGGILGGIGSGGVRLLGGAGGALASMGTQMTNRPLIQFTRKRAFLLLLLLLIPLILITAFAPTAPGQPGQPGQPGTPATGGTCPDQATIDANKNPTTCRYLNVGVNIFDTNISAGAIDTYVNKYANIFVSGGLGDINEFRRRVDYIVAKSKEVGLNPVLGLGYWKTESNFSTQGTRDLGCHESAVNFYEQVDCKLGINEFSDPRKNPITNCARSKDANGVACNALKDVRRVLDQTNPINYPISTFDDFAEAYGPRDPRLDCKPDGTCPVNNNCIGTYNKLVEVAKELNACQVSTTPPPGQGVPSGPLGFSITCPLAQGPASSFRILCGTATNPRSDCGHGVTGYPTRCNPAVYVCDTTSTQYPDGTYALYSPALYNAVDVRPASDGGSGSPVYLPFLDSNQPVNWTRVDGPTSLKGGEWGVKVVYEADYNGKKLRLDLTHLNQGIDLNSPLRSGHQVGILKPGLDRDGGGHLHTSLAVDGVWKDSISESYLCSNRTP